MKVGIVGYLANTGIGSLVEDYKKHLPIDSHYVISHPVIGVREEKLDEKCVDSRKVNVNDWLRTVDVVITIECPFIDNLFQLCHNLKKRVICAVDVDWFNPQLEQWKYVDTFICPNLYTKKQLVSYGFSNVVYIPCSIDTDYFTFKQRTAVNTYLFNNGWGGVDNRKGINEIIAVFMSHPEYPIRINSQRIIDINLPKNFTIVNQNFPERKSLYEHGDVYVAPSKWEGHGIHILEAMACGLPVIATDYPPMNEYVKKNLIKVSEVYHIVTGRLCTVKCRIDIGSLESLVKDMFRKDISQESEQVRKIVENEYSWKVNRNKFIDVIKGQKD